MYKLTTGRLYITAWLLVLLGYRKLYSVNKVAKTGKLSFETKCNHGKKNALQKLFSHGKTACRYLYI